MHQPHLEQHRHVHTQLVILKTALVALAFAACSWSCATGAGPVAPVSDWALASVGAPAAWSVSRGEGVVIAVIDSGIDDTSLPSLHRNDAGRFLWTGSPDNRVEADPVGHGTAVASIIAEDGDLGVTGVAPAAHVISIAVTNEGVGGSASSLAPAIMLAARLGATVINLSLGSFADDRATAAAVGSVVARGVIVVAAGGDTASGDSLFPARLPDVIAVQAIGKDGNVGPRANQIGPNGIQAPGKAVPAIVLQPQSRIPTAGLDSGSSMAAAIVSGSVALLVSCLRSHDRPVTEKSILGALTASTGGGAFFQLRRAMIDLGC